MVDGMTYPVKLDDLIAHINTSRPDDPLLRLSDAVLLGDRLGEVADHLIGHFVDQARRSGASWTDIGRSIGVSKQAAQKRFVGRPDLDPSHGFSRFSNGARKAVAATAGSARSGGHREIEPAHLLLGLLDVPGCVAERALADQGVDADTARAACQAALPPAADVPAEQGHIPFSGRSRKVFELTFREALRLGHHGVGTGHLLLALIEEEEAAGGLLAGLGAGKAATEAFVAAEQPRDDESLGQP
jgi:ClpA/ClpB-like protein